MCEMRWGAKIEQKDPARIRARKNDPHETRPPHQPTVRLTLLRFPPSLRCVNGADDRRTKVAFSRYVSARSRGANSSAPPHRSKTPVLERRCHSHCRRLPKPDSDREGAAPWWAHPVHAPCFVDRYFLWAAGSSNLSDHDQRGNPLVVSKRIKYIRQVGTTLRKTEHPNKPHNVLLVLYQRLLYAYY